MKNSKKVKVLFILPDLHAGGAQRILSFLAHYLNDNQFESHLLVIGKPLDSAYQVDSAKTTFLNCDRVLTGIPGIIKFLVKHKPRAVVSSLGHLNTVLGLIAPFFRKIKFIIREASVISEISKFVKGKKFYGLLSKLAYLNVDAVVCQSKDMAEDFKGLYSIPPDKIETISNPITQEFTLKSKADNSGIVNLITIGRLSEEKGQGRILKVLSKLEIPFKYTLIGSGPEKEKLFTQIKSYKMENKVVHIPFTSEVDKELMTQDVFLQGSYVEGFPNAVLESLVVGTPVIAFNVPGGTKEIVLNGINGFLVSTEEEFLTQLLRLLDMKLEPESIRNSVINRFSKERIVHQYENLIMTLVSN